MGAKRKGNGNDKSKVGLNRKVGEIKGKKDMKELISTREVKGTNQDRKCVFKNEEIKRGEKDKKNRERKRQRQADEKMKQRCIVGRGRKQKYKK